MRDFTAGKTHEIIRDFLRQSSYQTRAFTILALNQTTSYNKYIAQEIILFKLNYKYNIHSKQRSSLKHKNTLKALRQNSSDETRDL